MSFPSSTFKLEQSEMNIQKQKTTGTARTQTADTDEFESSFVIQV